MNITPQDFYHSMILHEIRLCKDLERDFSIAKTLDKTSKIVRKHGHICIDIAFGLFNPEIKTEKNIRIIKKTDLITHFKNSFGLAIIRTGRLTWQQISGDKEGSSHSCSRTALCYALIGDYDSAEKWLQRAEQYVSDLARPNYIRGLIQGSRGEPTAAAKYFKIALTGRALKTTKARIEQALSLTDSPAEEDLTANLTLVAHRGTHLGVEEDMNTMKAFQKAIELQCDYIETDILCTSDNLLVCFHGPKINGKFVKDVSFSELLNQSPQDICTFEDYLSLHGQIKLDIEIKDSGYEDLIWEKIRDIPTDRYVIKSFKLSVLSRLRELSPDIRLGYLIRQQKELTSVPPELHLSFISPKLNILDKPFQAKITKQGFETWPWTITTIHDAICVRLLGIDTIITDIPEKLKLS